MHCPYCGTITEEDEFYCVKCGEKLPSDLSKRFKPKRKFNRYWYLPMFIILFCLLSFMAYYFILHSNETNAKDFYEQGENSVLDEDYSAAKELFTSALTYKKNFYEAETALSFVKKVIDIENDLKEATAKQENHDFQEALSIVNAAENSLKNFHGTAVTQMINQIVAHRDHIKIEQLQNQLDEQPNIDKLKILLWESEAIKNEEAVEITSDIRNQIVDYTFSKASEQLNSNQFNDAQILVDDGLKYATDSEKLQSLKTTIEKEKTAFETAQQQRIEQAIHLAAEEQEINKSDAVKLGTVDIHKDDKGNWIVKGEVSSVATVPISSILIEYTLLTNQDNELLSNKVFVFPDKLYTNEIGKFEFTHYDIDKQQKNIQVKVNKITWYTD